MLTEVVQQVLSLAQATVQTAQRDRIEAYIRSYCRAIPHEVLLEVEPRTLLAFVMERFAFLETDFDRLVKVEVVDPGTMLQAEETPSTIIETRLPDCAFIIRTIKAHLREWGIQLHFVLHPIHAVVVSPLAVHDGNKVVGIDHERGTRYSQVYLQVSPIPPARRAEIRAALEHHLELTLIVNRDRHAMMSRLDEARAMLVEQSTGSRGSEASEAVELIDWFKEDNMILMSYARFPQSGNGDRRMEGWLGQFAAANHRDLEDVIGDIVVTRRDRAELYSFYRTDFMSVVRSVAQVRYFGVAELDASGKKVAEHVFVGLLSTKALKQPLRRVPVASKRIKEVLDRLEDQPGSYAYTKVRGILDSIPIEDLFYWNTDELFDVAEQFRLAESKDQARVFVWRRPKGRRITVVCVVPRMRFSEALREELSEEICKFLDVKHLRDYRQETDDESAVRLHFTVGKYRSGVSDGDLVRLSDGLELLLESWEDQLRDLVFKRYRTENTTTANEIWTRYASRFPESYQGALPPEIALLDIGLCEKLDDQVGLRVALVVLGYGDQRHTSLRIVSRKELLLNDVVPSLHRMALRTTSRLAERLGPDLYITGFEVSGADGRKIEDAPTLERLGTIVERVLSGHLLDDRLLGLGYLAGLDWQQIDLLITYRNYLVQAFPGFGTQSVDEALLKHSAFAALLVEYFQIKFATERSETPSDRTERLLPPLARRYDEMLEAVTVIQEDLILRYFLDVFEATRRTNYYRPGRGDAISIKIESGLVEHMPRPCPLYEVYVHAPGVEGIHLRGGKVARGGIRHSDRADDFRTEVLGLQRTQTLKNTVIVPLGAKGGFVTRKQGASRDEARAQYEVFIAGVLDVTDNYVAGGVVPPPGVIRHDDDDPYLVVAADKGTAHLSDVANAISQRYKFWLDDAFASGGSAGYDHKAMGITSRGGWTNVERHFRELAIDIRKTSIRVAGVGDMSGDVFGNAMLLNDHLKLVAAFNHRHVFVDPDPDPAASYAERKRLFTTPGAQWSDYARTVISKGGGVFERAAKEIRVSPEVKALLGLPGNVATGPELVRRILTLEVELMWFGGIGTYVKATTESHGEVGDKVNDNVRINATELHAKVIGEGANLAITQRARTEYSLAGGRCNTDAIDNSAGVDCSDHEVNLKILFAPQMTSGSITREERDKQLRELEPDVAAACVADNYLQSALLSMEAMRCRKRGESFLDLLSYLDKHNLNRLAEHVPPDDELHGWLATGKGLPRNLLAVLVAHCKLDLYDRVLASRLPDLPLFQPLLASYFPTKIVDNYREQIGHHRLRREIIATVATNTVINQAGCTLLVELCKESNQPMEELVVRYFLCDELIGARALRAAIHASDYEVKAADQYAALLALEDVHRRLLRWWAWNDGTWKLSPDDIAATKHQFEIAAEALVNSLEGPARLAYEARAQDLVLHGFDPELATSLARVSLMRDGFALIAAARDAHLPLEATAALFQRVGSALHVDKLDALLATQVPANVWERRFHVSLEREAAGIRQLGISKLAANSQYVEMHRDRTDKISDSLRMVKQLGGHGLVPLYLILEDYRAPW